MPSRTPAPRYGGYAVSWHNVPPRQARPRHRRACLGMRDRGLPLIRKCLYSLDWSPCEAHLAKPLFETEPEIAPLPQTARQLDAALRAKIELLLSAAKVWNLHSYGWINAYDADPEFIGHAMWQTDPPFEHDHLWGIRRRRNASPPPRPQPTEKEELLSVSGADFDGLMDAARMSIGLFLLQVEAMREFQFHDDRFFDLHQMSAIIYLATASERIREFFVAAAFGVPQQAYQEGAYGKSKRTKYTTPFLEAKEMLSEASPDLAEPLSKALPLAEQIVELRKTRNKLVHELATAIGRRERQMLQERPQSPAVDDFKFEDFQKMKEAAKALHERRIVDAMRPLADWYDLLARLSNEVFKIEHVLRGAATREVVPSSSS